MLKIALSVLLLCGPMHVLGASCSAKNDVGDSCSIDCAVGQSADCQNGTGATSPSCECKGDVSENLFHPLSPAAKKMFALSGTAASRVNVRQQVNAALGQLRDYHLGETCRNEKVGVECDHSVHGNQNPSLQIEPSAVRRCFPVYERVCRRVVGKLSAGEITYPSVIEAAVETPNWKAIPSEYLGYRETYTNCTPEKQSWTFKHSERVTVGHRVSKTRGLDTERSVSASIKYTFAPGVEGGTSASFKQTVKISDVEEENFSDDRTVEETFPVVVPAMALLTFDHFWIRREIPVPYSGQVQVDGVLASNAEGVTRISQVLNDASRVFQFAGLVSDARLYEGQVRNVSRPLKAAECSAPVMRVRGERYTEIR